MPYLVSDDISAEDLDGIVRLIQLIDLEVLDLVYDLKAFGHASKDRVLVVQPWRGHGRDEELRAVGAGTGIGHRHRVRTIVSK